MHPERPYLTNFQPELVPSPCFVVDTEALERNAKILSQVSQASGAKILLALKGYAYSHTFPILKPHLYGVCASSPHEAQLGKEAFGKEVHSYAPAFTAENLRDFLKYSDHLVFNSLSQWQRFKKIIVEHPAKISVGLRINPEYSEAQVELYDPCAKGSRLGIPKRGLNPDAFEGVDGLHFHSLCEQGSDVLERTLKRVEEDFGEFLPKLKWVNFGGGHHITQPDYDTELLVELVKSWKSRYDLEVYLEPGEAIGVNTGALVASVLDVVDYGEPFAILDISATCHIGDVLEMPFRPTITDAGEPGEKAFTYRLGGLSCLAGDVVGQYSFDRELCIGDRLVFEDMSHYTMVKTTNFNGIQLPSIGTWSPKEQTFTLTRSFGYESYASRIS